MADQVQSDGYLGQMDPTTQENLFNALNFLVEQIANKNWTITLGLVKGVHGGGVDAPPTVDVQPMVNQTDGYNKATPHGTIYGLPVWRMQAGTVAVIADPIVGDIGILATANRDISSVVANKAVANPGSKRTFDPSDGIYIGSLLGGKPTQFLQMSKDGINLVFSDTISIKITTNGIVLTVGSSIVNISSTGVSIMGHDFITHAHTGVTTGGGFSGPVKP